ncbi:MAG: ATP-binding protein [Verrucomicrobiota bacterium]
MATTFFADSFCRSRLPLACAFLWVIGCGIVDWLTGPELASSVFYLPAVVIAGWFHGRQAAVVIAVFSSMTWMAAEFPSQIGQIRTIVPYWNAAVRLMVFLVTAILVSEVRIRQAAEAALGEQRGILSSILDSMADAVVVVDSNQRLIVYNPASKELFRQDALDRSMTEWLDQLEANPTGTHRNLGILHEALRNPDKVTGEITLSDEHGNDQFIAFQALPLAPSSFRSVGKVLVFSDLTTQRQFEKRVAKATQQEQRRIAQDLHDGLCQHLAGIAFGADSLQTSLAASPLATEAAHAGEIARLIREGIHQTKTLARGLFPIGLEESLATALQYLAIIAESRSDIPCVFEAEDEAPRLLPETAGHLFRIAQESVSNAVHHSGCKKIIIRLLSERNFLTLEITDDGDGLNDSSINSPGIGLQIMRHRAYLIGAVLKFRSPAAGGTVVSCGLPLRLNS